MKSHAVDSDEERNEMEGRNKIKTGKKVGKRQRRYNEEKRKVALTVVFRLVDGLQHLASVLLSAVAQGWGFSLVQLLP